MTRQFIAALLSLSLAMTAMTTAPARADEDVAKIIAGLAVLGILSQVVKKNREKDQVVTRRDADVRPFTRHERPHYKKQRHQKVAPQRCLREQWTHRGTRNVYGARCMENNARAALPRECLRRAETRQGMRRFYAPRCLRQNGWRA